MAIDTRRRFLLQLSGAFFLAPLVSACGREKKSGPVDIDWHHEHCARCQMIIWNRKFATEIRAPSGQIWKFDDIGCAMVWLAKQNFSEFAKGAEVWVNSYASEDWLDARSAHYVYGVKSPMRYQYGALEKFSPGNFDYGAMKKQILLLGR